MADLNWFWSQSTAHMALLNMTCMTWQPIKTFMEYEAYHCLDLNAPQLDVLSWPYKWNVLHNGFIPNHFNPSLQMSKGRHKGKIQLSIGLPIQTAHPTFPMRSYKKMKKKKRKKKQQNKQRQKLNFRYLQKHWAQGRTQRFWSPPQHNFYCCKNWKDRKKGREGENKRTEAAAGRGWKRDRGYIYIPRSSTRTSGHEMQKLKIICWHLEKLIRGKNRRVYIRGAKHRW